ncbi:hypothetical protein AVEN_1732-1, partial [Araneus ventricosus]
MKNLRIVIGFWITVGSNFFTHAEEGQTAPFGGSIRESLGETTPAGFLPVLQKFHFGRSVNRLLSEIFRFLYDRFVDLLPHDNDFNEGIVQTLPERTPTNIVPALLKGRLKW